MMTVMDSKKIKKMVCRAVKVSGKPKAVEEEDENHSLMIADQPMSDDEHGVHVPKGFVAVYVGPDHRRFVIPTKILSEPGFKAMMDKAAEEYGYEQQGGLTIPCGEDDFKKLLEDCKFKSKSNKCKSSYIYYQNHYTNSIPV
ncbi:auxin-induced protein x10a [Phtheirospermum japonicum]|uniref:Auxin-induced protein x10a n=1 Tax=Phtheirospermum japonicum TaxID=374723 RepID=A0A830B4S6_9LAMI|nr:auxin-induced protein x10a [Phtheirospermum japonicum]